MSLRIPIALAIILFISGCTATKSATAGNSLKADDVAPHAPNRVEAIPDPGFTTLNALTDQFAEDFAAQCKQKQKIFLDRVSIREANTNDVANLSSTLENELEASLSRKFQLVYEPEEADYLLVAVFQRYGRMLRIFFKVHNVDLSGTKSMDYSIASMYLPEDSLKVNLHSKAAQLAADIIGQEYGRKIYIQPVELDSCSCVSDFSRSFSSLLKTAIVRMYRTVEIIDEKPVKARLANTRGLQKKAKKVEKLATSDAYFADADAVLEGSYFVNGDTVTVSLMLKDLQGHVLNSSSVDIDRKMIHTQLNNQEAEQLADLADTSSEDSKDLVKISTSKGSNQPLYHKGEVITFFIQVAKPMYVYIYDITSRDGIELLYPYDADGVHPMLYPGQLYTIPAEDDQYTLKVAPPYGLDAVKIFASPVKLPVPGMNSQVASRSYRGGVRAITKKRKDIQEQLAGSTSINPKDLVDYYRGLKQRFHTEIVEDSLMVETQL
jgi:hypothetical protein